MKNDTLEPQGIRSTFIPFGENRFKPSPVKETIEDKNLIDFRNKHPLWMHGVERHGNPIGTKGTLFIAFCIFGALYFIFR